ncbi:MAG: redoxin domain-containing protein [Planctomycetes bacterium]|nr:redoxin domain-containing protein [Planctomycetota bacterium]
MEQQGGRLLAVSVDSPTESRRFAERLGLQFPLLCDTDGSVLRSFGVVHSGAGRGGADIAIPANVLIGRGGRILWRYVPHRIQERLDPAKVLKAVRALREQPDLDPEQRP